MYRVSAVFLPYPFVPYPPPRAQNVDIIWQEEVWGQRRRSGMAVRCETETPFFDLTIQFCLIEWYSILIIILCRCIWPSRAVTINASCVNVFQKYIVFYLFQAALICLFRIWTKMNFKRLVSTSFLGQSCQQGFEDPVWCFNNFCTSPLVELLALKVLSRTSIASCTWASHGLKHCLKYILWYL